jgi:hypothetical protein
VGTKGTGLQFRGHSTQQLFKGGKLNNELLPDKLRKSLPPLYSQENVKDPVVHIKFFTPDSNWTWYVTEGSPEGDDFIFFGYVVGFEKEWGYFTLSELIGARGPSGMKIERDLHFQPTPFQQLAEDISATSETHDCDDHCRSYGCKQSGYFRERDRGKGSE